MPRPDAVFIHKSLKRGAELGHRVNSIADIAIPLLQPDTLNGEQAHIRSIAYKNYIFVTRDPRDSILYPLGHPREKQPRYHWVEQPGSDGKIRLGTLLDNLPQAKATADGPNQPAVSVDSAVAS
jgi:hypothetical protein